MSDHLLVELRRLQSENRELREKLRINGRHARRIQRAYDCALLLSQWYVAHLPTCREFAKAHGVSQRSWQNGIALLRLARICDQANRWKVHELTSIECKLARAATIAIDVPSAFYARGSKHMRQ